MKVYEALIDNRVIGSNIKYARNFFQRLIGLLRHKKLENGEGLLIAHCRQIHTIGMKFNIDVVFLNEYGEIIYIQKDMKSGKISRTIDEAYHVLELESGSVEKYDIKLFSNIKFLERK